MLWLLRDDGEAPLAREEYLRGARVGAVTRSVTDCESKAGEVIGHLLGGRMSDRFVVSCEMSGGSVLANASAVFESWTVLTPDFAVSMSTEAFLEPER